MKKIPIETVNGQNPFEIHTITNPLEYINKSYKLCQILLDSIKNNDLELEQLKRIKYVFPSIIEINRKTQIILSQKIQEKLDNKRNKYKK